MDTKLLEMLSQAHKNIRSSRDGKYFNAFDTFTNKWTSVLDIPEDLAQYVGADVIVGIDLLIENATSEFDIYIVQNYLSTIFSMPFISFNFDENSVNTSAKDVAIIIGYLLSQPSQDSHSSLYKRWYQLFQHQFLEMIRQMADQTRMGEIYAKHQPMIQPNATIEDYFYSYTVQFAKTSSVSMSILLAVLYSPYLSDALLTGLINILDGIDVLYRLISDLHIDVEEPINAQIYAYACIHNISCAEAHLALIANNLAHYKTTQKQFYMFAMDTLSSYERQFEQVLSDPVNDVQVISQKLIQTLLGHARLHLHAMRGTIDI